MRYNITITPIAPEEKGGTMEFLKLLGATVWDAVDALADANRRLALFNRLKAIERAETAKASALYEELGRYVAAVGGEISAEKVQELKTAAEEAEQHAALARRHLEWMRGAEAPAAPTKEDTPAEEAAAEEPAAEEAPTGEAAAAVTIAEEAMAEEPVAEEAAEDENDGIPFM